MITGRLQIDTPSLFSKLKRLFTVEEIKLFEEAYHQISELPIIIEENKWREEGVNFSPRPARILDLLIEAKIRSKEQLLQALRLLPEVVSHLASPQIETFRSFPELHWAVLLDSIRHLCYHPDSKCEYHALSETLITLEKHLPQPSEPSHLQSKARAAIRQYQKYA